MSIQDLNTELSNLYNTKCCTHLPNLQAQNILGLTPKVLTNMVSQVWKDKGLPKGVINKDVTTAFAKHLYAGVETGFGKSLSQLDYDAPDYNMLKSLQENTWTFAAAKNYTQLRELSDALLDEKGKQRSKQAFFEAAASINDKHVVRYLSAEWELAVVSSQMASKWVDIQKHKPKLLLFDAVMDTSTTVLCMSLNDTQLPPEHPFWDRYYLPNHFGERSTIRQLYSGVATDESKIPSADIHPMFQTNLAKHGLVFPKGHSYYNGLPAEILQTLTGKAKIFAKQAIYKLPLEEQYATIYESTTGGVVKQHKLHLPKPNDSNDDYLDIIDTAKIFANEGKAVQILPEINVSESTARKLILNGLQDKSANPDFKINDLFMDLKRPESTERILKNAHKASSNKCEAIIKVDNLDTEDMNRIANSLSYKNEYTQDNIHFVKGKKVYSFPVNAKGDKH